MSFGEAPAAVPPDFGPQTDEFHGPPRQAPLVGPLAFLGSFVGVLFLLSLAGFVRSGKLVACLMALVTFLLLLGILLGILLLRLRASVVVVRVFAEGLVRTQRGTQEVVRWDDFLDFRLSASDRTPTQSTLLLRTRSGRTLSFERTLQRRDELQLLIEAETYARLWPRLLERFRKGERLVFGHLRADKRGLTVEGYGFEVLPWHHIDRVELVRHGTAVEVRQEGAFLTWFSESIPNPHLFLALVDHVHLHGPPI